MNLDLGTLRQLLGHNWPVSQEEMGRIIKMPPEVDSMAFYKWLADIKFSHSMWALVMRGDAEVVSFSESEGPRFILNAQGKAGAEKILKAHQRRSEQNN